MSERESTAPELGAKLRRTRARTGYSAAEFAKIVGWSTSKVSRIETELRGITEMDVVRYAAYCRATPDEMEDLITRCREAEIPGFWLSRRLSTLIFHEHTAVSSLSYDPVVVPELLQTENYLNALVRCHKLAARDADYQVKVHLDRQDVLRRRHFGFFIHEQALRFPVGDDRLMHEQLRKLVVLAEHPWLSIRVVPLAAGPRGAFGSEFGMFRFEDARPLLHLGHRNVGLFLEETSVVEEYQEQLASIADVALDRGRSRELLAALANVAEEQLQQ
jgi:transcriptional regulator with XRE-family HTH domain